MAFYNLPNFDADKAVSGAWISFDAFSSQFVIMADKESNKAYLINKNSGLCALSIAHKQETWGETLERIIDKYSPFAKIKYKELPKMLHERWADWRYEMSK